MGKPVASSKPFGMWGCPFSGGMWGHVFFSGYTFFVGWFWRETKKGETTFVRPPKKDTPRSQNTSPYGHLHVVGALWRDSDWKLALGMIRVQF